MKNKKWISLATAVVLAVTALPLGVFAAKKDEAKLAKVTLNEVAHSIFYAPQYVAIEDGYFAEEGLDLTLVTGVGADKVLTALISGEADIGFMGAEASIYAYQEGATDPAVNFAQLTQRAGNFLVAREEMQDFKWEDLKGKKVLGGRKGGMPEMVFEYILKQYNIDPTEDLSIDQSIDFGSTAAAFSGGQGDFLPEGVQLTVYAYVALAPGKDGQPFRGGQLCAAEKTDAVPAVVHRPDRQPVVIPLLTAGVKFQRVTELEVSGITDPAGRMFHRRVPLF